MPVAIPLALHLDAPLKLCFAAKIPHPRLPIIGLGAVSLGRTLCNHDYLTKLSVSLADFRQSARHANHILLRRVRNLAPSHGKPERNGAATAIPNRASTIILVDDGLATGYTALAAINQLAACQPQHVIVAAPVCSRYAIATLKRAPIPVTLVVLQYDTALSFLVDDHYAEFPALSDKETSRLYRQQNPYDNDPHR